MVTVLLLAGGGRCHQRATVLLVVQEDNEFVGRAL